MSKMEPFGKDLLLAIASKLSENCPDAVNDAESIARRAKVEFIELCARSLLQKKHIDLDNGIKYGALVQEIPDDACKDALSGAFWLMSVYEYLNAYKLGLQNSQWFLAPASADKRKRGQYFTPRNLTQLSTQSALQKLFEVRFGADHAPSLNEIKALRIVDPAMGAGAFLVCALDYFVSATDCAFIQEIAEDCLHGVDIDPLAADVTCVVVALFCSLKLGSAELMLMPKLRCHLKTGNSLVGCWFEDSDQKFENASGFLPADSFHWQFEFSDVFASGGFDAVLSNPPWEILKSNTREFFSNSEKQFFEGFSRFLRNSSERAKEIKIKYGINVPFKAQGGSDLNSYKLFAELAFCLLAKNGCMSLIVPSGIYTDHGTRSLRELFFEEGDVFEIISFLNKDQTFFIHSSFNFCVFSVCNRASGGQIVVSFGHQNALEATRDSLQTVNYSVADMHRFSPTWRSLLEVTNPRDLQILRKIYANSAPLSSTKLPNGSEVKFKREFDLTNDSASFVTRSEALEARYMSDQYGNFLKGDWHSFDGAKEDRLCRSNLVFSRTGEFVVQTDEVESVLLPLYEGRMLGQFDCRQKAHISGNGRTAIWKANAEDDALIQPQFLLPLEVTKKRSNLDSVKIGYLAVGSSTNARTMIAAALSGMPCGNSVPVLTLGEGVRHNLALLACLNSFVFDFVLRSKMTGNNINFYLLQECPLPDLDALAADLRIICLASCLSFNHRRFAREALQVFSLCDQEEFSWDSFSSLTRAKARAALDAIVAKAYGLDYDELAWILRDGLDLKGFWRIDKGMRASERHTAQTLKLFRHLLEVGNAEFFRCLLPARLDTDSRAEAIKIARLETDAQILEAIYATASLPFQSSLRIGR